MFLQQKWVLYVLFLFTPLILFAEVSSVISPYARDLRMVAIVSSSVFQKKAKAVKWKKAGWHVRTCVHLKIGNQEYVNAKNSGTFGALSESRDGKDIQDIQRFDKGLFWITFPHFDWEKGRGDYSSDYHHWDPASKKREERWTFQIKSSQPNKLHKASFTFSLDGVYIINVSTINGQRVYRERRLSKEALSEFSLVDVDRHKRYPYEKLSTTHFKMDGKAVRTFRWVRGEQSLADYALVQVVIPKKAENHSFKDLSVKSVKEMPQEPEATPDFIPDPPFNPENKFGMPPEF